MKEIELVSCHRDSHEIHENYPYYMSIARKPTFVHRLLHINPSKDSYVSNNPDYVWYKEETMKRAEEELERELNRFFRLKIKNNNLIKI